MNYQADRFKQHLDRRMACDNVQSSILSFNEKLPTAFLALLCWIFLDLGGSWAYNEARYGMSLKGSCWVKHELYLVEDCL